MMMWSKPIKNLVNRGYTSQQGSEPDKPAEPSGFEPGSDMVHLAQVWLKSGASGPVIYGSNQPTKTGLVGLD